MTPIRCGRIYCFWAIFWISFLHCNTSLMIFGITIWIYIEVYHLAETYRLCDFSLHFYISNLIFAYVIFKHSGSQLRKKLKGFGRLMWINLPFRVPALYQKAEKPTQDVFTYNLIDLKICGLVCYCAVNLMHINWSQS